MLGNPQSKWDTITQAIKKAATDTFGLVQKTRKQEDPTIALLSKKQKDLRLRISNTTNHDKEKELRTERNTILSEIHHLTQKLKEKDIDNHLQEIEKTKNDSTRMFQVIKQMQNFKPKIPLLIETGKGKLTANEHE